MRCVHVLQFTITHAGMELGNCFHRAATNDREPGARALRE